MLTGVVKHSYEQGECFKCKGHGTLGGEDGRPVVNRAGYIDRQRGLYLITTSGFAEACAGHDPKEVARELSRRGWLFRNEGDKLKSKHAVPCLPGRPTFYAVRDTLIEGRDGE